MNIKKSPTLAVNWFLVLGLSMGIFLSACQTSQSQPTPNPSQVSGLQSEKVGAENAVVFSLDSGNLSPITSYIEHSKSNLDCEIHEISSTTILKSIKSAVDRRVKVRFIQPEISGQTSLTSLGVQVKNLSNIDNLGAKACVQDLGTTAQNVLISTSDWKDFYPTGYKGYAVQLQGLSYASNQIAAQIEADLNGTTSPLVPKVSASPQTTKKTTPTPLVSASPVAQPSTQKAEQGVTPPELLGVVSPYNSQTYLEWFLSTSSHTVILGNGRFSPELLQRLSTNPNGGNYQMVLNNAPSLLLNSKLKCASRGEFYPTILFGFDSTGKLQKAFLGSQSLDTNSLYQNREIGITLGPIAAQKLLDLVKPGLTGCL
jgi:hypothetical protein